MFEVEIIVWEGLEKLTTLIYLNARKKELSLRSLGIGAIGLSCVPPVSRATRYWVTRHWRQPSSRRCTTDGAKSFCPSLCKRPTGSSQPQLEYSVSLRHSDLWHGQYQYYINYICNRSFGFFFYFFFVVFFKIIVSSNTLFHMNISTSGGQWENHQVMKQHKILSSGTPGSSSFPAPWPHIPTSPCTPWQDHP